MPTENKLKCFTFTITEKDGQIIGVEVRIISQGKTHILSMPIQKSYPLEFPGVSVDKKALSEIGDQKEEVEVKSEKKVDEKNEEPGRMGRESTQPPCAAAGIACCKTKLMPDHVLSRRGCVRKPSLVQQAGDFVLVRDCAAQWHQCLCTVVAPVCPVIHPIGYLLFCFCCFL